MAYNSTNITSILSGLQDILPSDLQRVFHKVLPPAYEQMNQGTSGNEIAVIHPPVQKNNIKIAAD